MTTEGGGWTLIEQSYANAFWNSRPYYYFSYPAWAWDMGYNEYFFVDQGLSVTDWHF